MNKLTKIQLNIWTYEQRSKEAKKRRKQKKEKERRGEQKIKERLNEPETDRNMVILTDKIDNR